MSTKVFAYSTSKYDSNDVAIINKVIPLNNLYYNIDEPDGWDFITWTKSTPKKVAKILLSCLDVRGALDLRGLNALTDIDVSNNYLSSLNVSGSTALKNIYCNLNLTLLMDKTY